MEGESIESPLFLFVYVFLTAKKNVVLRTQKLKQDTRVF